MFSQPRVDARPIYASAKFTNRPVPAVCHPFLALAAEFNGCLCDVAFSWTPGNFGHAVTITTSHRPTRPVLDSQTCVCLLSFSARRLVRPFLPRGRFVSRRFGSARVRCPAIEHVRYIIRARINLAL